MYDMDASVSATVVLPLRYQHMFLLCFCEANKGGYSILQVTGSTRKNKMHQGASERVFLNHKTQSKE